MLSNTISPIADQLIWDLVTMNALAYTGITQHLTVIFHNDSHYTGFNCNVLQYCMNTQESTVKSEFKLDRTALWD